MTVPSFSVFPSGLDAITDEDFKRLHEISEALAEEARKGDEGTVNDLQGMAIIADCIALLTGSEPNDVDDFMGNFSRLLNAWLWTPTWPNAFASSLNEEYITRFGDEGFKPEYQEPRGANYDPSNSGGRNQVTHFVGYVAAGYYGQEVVADCYLYFREVIKQHQTTDSADYLLGKIAIRVGAALQRYKTRDSTWIDPEGNVLWQLRPDEVGDWIRRNLALAG